MNRKGRISCSLLVIGAGTATVLACSSESEEHESGGSVGSNVAGASQGSGGDVANGNPGFAARRYDAERDCFGEVETIDVLYLEEQYVGHESASTVVVCLISPAGVAYVQDTGGSVAVVQTEPTAGWKVPVWRSGTSEPFDYSEFTPEDQAVCAEALNAWGTSATRTTCPDEEVAAGGTSST